MDFLEIAFLIGIGLAAGFINTVAGGGSLLTLPVLIFMGLPPAVANGTNRIALVLQNIIGVAGFKSKGIFVFPYSLWLGISSLLGAILGAHFSVQIRGELFNQILAVVMVGVVLITVFNPIKNPDAAIERLGKKHQWIGIIIFFFVGIYGGFIQAGVGFLIMGALTFINKVSLVKANSIKVFVVLTYTISALIVFIVEGSINWIYGLTLALGNMTGAWVASRWSVRKGDKWIRWFMIVMVTAMAIKLWISS